MAKKKSKSASSGKSTAPQAWVVSVRMGLGHQRASYALRYLCPENVLNVGEIATSSPEEMKLWTKLTSSYEAISRLKSVPLIGQGLFNLYNRILYIPPFYPLRDLSEPNLQSRIIRRYIEKGLGKKLMEKITSQPLPMISTYPVPALIADYYGHRRNYCVVTDAEINRAWVPVDAAAGKTYYFAPCSRAMLRLREYGVRDEQIYLTGFPLPKSLLGSERLEVLLADYGQRINYLDPGDQFWPLHGNNVEHFLGRANVRFRKKRLLTLVYAVGGAGALWEIGLHIAKSLRAKILKKELRLVLVCGVRKEIRDNFARGLKDLKIPAGLVPLVYAEDKDDYFERFNQLMRVTDVLWTKPSELVFYSGLGIPIIMTEPVGSQESYNRKWLLEVQAGIEQEDPAYTDEWFGDLLKLGRLAECSWDGFLKARKYGTYKMEEIMRTGTMIRESSPLRR
ncbi:MAG: hypothetical protein JXD23_00345 [Spirochaetales bacterium]|nr:hypothetical protein [Spirochaetales bacterium]